MMLFILGIALFFVLLLCLPYALRKVFGGTGRYFVVALIVAVLLSLPIILTNFIQTLEPGEVGRAYGLSETSMELSIGYNFVPPWYRVHRWDMRSQSLSFSEGDAADDAFGAQTSNGDYLTAIASITVRIDPDRLEDYIERFGSERIEYSPKIAQILKYELKRAMENSLSKYETRDLMGNKAKAANEARDTALEYLQELPFVVETLWYVDFEASAEYEAAIREQADLRMRTDRATLQESLNRQEAQNNKVRADGDAEVLRISARAEADAAEIRANNEAQVALILAQNEAEMVKIAAARDAEAKKIQAAADAEATKTRAQAEAEARIATDAAEAQGAEAIGKAYQLHPELMELKRIELETAWAMGWNGMLPQFQGLESFNFADLTSILSALLPTQPQDQSSITDLAEATP